MSSRAKHPNRCARLWAQQTMKAQVEGPAVPAGTTPQKMDKGPRHTRSSHFHKEPPQPVPKKENVIQSEVSESLRPHLGATNN